MKHLVRLLISSPRPLFRTGLAAVLGREPTIQIVDETDSLSNAPPYPFDIVLWDVRGIEAQESPARFIALVSEPGTATAWLRAGAAGCVLDTASVEELLSAIRQVARGDTFLSPPLMNELLSSVPKLVEQEEPPIEPLTERENEVLKLLGEGSSNKDIAQKLYLSVRTVEGHLGNIYGKLHLRSRTEAALWAARNL